MVAFWKRVRDRRQRTYRAPYEGDYLNEGLRGGEIALVPTVQITKGAIALYGSDRPMYDQNVFYRGGVAFGPIKRSMGDLLDPQITFADGEVTLSNVDGALNPYFFQGADYGTFLNARVLISWVLESQYAHNFPVFDGLVKPDGGVQRGVKDVTFVARDKLDNYNVKPNLPTINATDFPGAPDESIGKIIPMVLGDWTAGFNFAAGYGAPAQVKAGGLDFNVRTKVPENFYGGVVGYCVGAVAGGAVFVFATGNFPTVFGVTSAVVKRGDVFIDASPSTVTTSAGYWTVDINGLYEEGTGTGVDYEYQQGDVLLLACAIQSAGGVMNNVINIAGEILDELLGITSGYASSGTLSLKATPAQSALATIKGRVWIGNEDQTVLEIVRGLLAQVRVELRYDFNSDAFNFVAVHPEDWLAPNSMTAQFTTFGIVEESFKIQADERNFFNVAMANYAFTPTTEKTTLQTGKRQNADGVAEAERTVVKVIDFPNLYVASDVQYQLDEFIRLFSAGLEYITFKVPWTGLAPIPGDFAGLRYTLSGVSLGDDVYGAVPLMIRDMNIELSTMSVEVRALSFANFPYTNYSPHFNGHVTEIDTMSSASQTITDA